MQPETNDLTLMHGHQSPAMITIVTATMRRALNDNTNVHHAFARKCKHLKIYASAKMFDTCMEKLKK
jgi:uncharacterized protein with von Willebrand factor type A (vWA) domain